MKTRLLFIAVLSAISFALNAQNADSSSNETLFDGHIIRIYKNVATGYGYDIFYQDNLIIHQKSNPFTASPDGLKNKEDALKIAKWQIIHLPPANHQMVQGRQTIPMEVARQLNITIK
jgi:hypothetical protein